jgi:CBS domain-containing protein
MSKTIIGALPVSALTADEVLRVDATADLWTVASALAAADVGILVVGDGNDVQGVVSERDVVRALAAHRGAGETTAGDIAHRDLVWCDINADVADVAEEMMERYVRHVLVEDDGHLVGIVSVRDLLGAYASGEFPDDDDEA